MHRDDFRLELKVETTDYGYLTRVRSSASYPDSAPFELSVSRRELAELHEALRTASASDRLANTTLREELQAWGVRLFESLFRDEVLAGYRAIKHAADSAGRELRVHLDLSDMAELARLPWEYLYDGGRQEFVGLSAGTLFTRYIGLMQRLNPPQRDGPLRVLVVIPSPDGYPEIDVQRSWLGLLDHVDGLAHAGKLIVEWLQKPTLFDLQRQLRSSDYYILHFMGHCQVDPNTGEGQLVFEDEMGRGRVVGGDHLGTLLRDHFTLSMTLLSGGVVSGRRGNRTIGAGYGNLDVAQRLLHRGMGAAVAMPFDMPGDETTQYMARLYAEIADLIPVDRSAALARAALDADSIWWGAPVVYTRAPDGNLFARPKSELERLSAEAEENIAFRLSALRIRTATPEAMARWSDDLAESRLKRRMERD